MVISKTRKFTCERSDISQKFTTSNRGSFNYSIVYPVAPGHFFTPTIFVYTQYARHPPRVNILPIAKAQSALRWYSSAFFANNGPSKKYPIKAAINIPIGFPDPIMMAIIITATINLVFPDTPLLSVEVVSWVSWSVAGLIRSSPSFHIENNTESFDKGSYKKMTSDLSANKNRYNLF